MRLGGIRLQMAGAVLLLSLGALGLGLSRIAGGFRDLTRHELAAELEDSARVVAAAVERQRPEQIPPMLAGVALERPRWLALVDDRGQVTWGRPHERGGRLGCRVAGADHLCAAIAVGGGLRGLVVVGAPAPHPVPLDERLVLLVVGLVALAAVFAWVFASDVAHDLSSAAAQIELISAADKIDLHRPLSVTYPDEIAELVATVGKLRGRLARELDEYQAAVRKAEHADHARDLFLRDVEESVRGPLVKIREHARWLLDERAGPLNASQREDLESVLTGSRHLEDLMRDILDLSALEGNVTLKLAAVDLGTVLQEVVTAAEPLVAKKNLTVGIDLPGSLPQVRGEDKRLRQVFGNLMGNAIKFTSKGEVMVIARVDGGWIDVAVRDTGAGIDPGDLPYIFAEFQQVGKTRQRRGGAGLGLAIVKKLVDLHGGRISVESVLGKGSTFRVRLPLPPREPAAAAPRPAAAEVRA